MSYRLCGMPPQVKGGLPLVHQVIFSGSLKACNEERKFRELIGWTQLRVELG